MIQIDACNIQPETRLLPASNSQLPHMEDGKFPGICLIRRYIRLKQKQPKINSFTQHMCSGCSEACQRCPWRINYFAVRPIWTYRAIGKQQVIQIQGDTAEFLTVIFSTPWYVPNHVIQKDLKLSSVRDETKHRYSRSRSRLPAHPNKLARKLLCMTQDTYSSRQTVISNFLT